MNEQFNYSYSISEGFDKLPVNHTYVIGEAGNNHNGDLQLAFGLVDAAVNAGCDGIKFQKRDIPHMMTGEHLEAPFTKRSPQPGCKTYGDVRYAIEPDEEMLLQLKEYCRDKIDFIVTPFDLISLEMLERIGVDGYKVAGFSITDHILLEALAQTSRPIVMSVGACTSDELTTALEILKNNDVALLHCISCYPMAPEDANLGVMPWLSGFGRTIGYSDHEDGSTVVPVAIGMGARIVEKHYTTDRSLAGFDHAMSLDPTMLKDYVEVIRRAERAIGGKTDRETIVPCEQFVVENKMKALVAERDIAAGSVITAEDLTTKAPNQGISPTRYREVIGRTAAKAIAADTHIQDGDLA